MQYFLCSVAHHRWPLCWCLPAWVAKRLRYPHEWSLQEGMVVLACRILMIPSFWVLHLLAQAWSLAWSFRSAFKCLNIFNVYCEMSGVYSCRLVKWCIHFKGNLYLEQYATADTSCLKMLDAWLPFWLIHWL